MKILVGVSNRHAHLTEETLYKLFGTTELTAKYNLNQPGEFASDLKISIKYQDKQIDNVRIVGPTRKYNQVEVLPRDEEYFNAVIPRRKSGDVKDSLPVTLIGPNGTEDLKEGLVIAERHIHMSESEAEKLDLKEDEEVGIFKEGIKLFTAKMKLKEPSFTEMHIDKDDAEKFNLTQNEMVDVYKY